MTRVLLVEDDRLLGRTLAERLEKEQFEVGWAQTIADAHTKFAEGPWHLAIVDVRLPDGSGFGFAREIKKVSSVPIMFMTALNSAENRLEGFEIGAEEYLPKPFHLKEFLIRVRHVLERKQAPRTVKVGELVLDLDALTVESKNGERVFLQVRDAKVLELLIQSAPKVVDRSMILDRVWGEDQFPTARAVDNAIVRLRQALKDESGEIIRSVRGVGYQWAPLT